jgi:hypothetical protein
VTDKPYQRHHTAVCHGDAALGLFMRKLTSFLAGTGKPAKFKDDFGIEREGIAATREWWADELGLTHKQVTRILHKADNELGYTVRAVRSWGRHRVTRLHIAVTEAYLAELTLCAKIGPTAYLKSLKSKTKGLGQRAQVGTVSVPPEGTVSVPAVGTPHDSVHTFQETHGLLAGVASLAREPSPGEEYSSVPGEEPSALKSPPTPHTHTVQIDAEYEINFSEGVVTTTSIDLAEKLSVPTVTGDGLARKLRLLGVLEDWKSVCAKNGVLAASDIADDQLAVLDQRCVEQRAITGCARPDAMRVLLINAAVRSGSLSADDAYADIIDAGTYPTLVEDIDALLRLPEPDKVVPLFPPKAA